MRYSGIKSLQCAETETAKEVPTLLEKLGDHFANSVINRCYEQCFRQKDQILHTLHLLSKLSILTHLNNGKVFLTIFLRKTFRIPKAR